MGEAFDWTNAVVAIIGRRLTEEEEPGERSRPVGTGFVVSDRGLIASCVHVVRDLTDWPYQRWDQPIQVRFRATGRYVDAYVLEKYFKPELDLTILALRTALPDDVEPLPLASEAGSEGHTTSMWGHPAGYEMGLLGRGEVLGIEGQGWLQLTSAQTTHGYSGGPVWDNHWRRVIGMIVSGTNEDKIGRLQYENFALRAEALVEACDGLGLELSKPNEGSPASIADSEGQTNETASAELDLSALRVKMSEYFSLSDLQTICFDMGIDYDDIRGGSKSVFIRELIIYVQQRGQLNELIEELRKARPKVTWR